MRLTYYPDTDTLAIALTAHPSTESEEIAPDVVADFDAHGQMVSLEIEHASAHVDLDVAETTGLPDVRVLSAARRMAGDDLPMHAR